MTPPVLLTASTPFKDTNPLNVPEVDPCSKRNLVLPPLTSSFAGIFSTLHNTVTSIDLSIEYDAYDPSDALNSACPSQRQWTGAPIRAIVPLPRRHKRLGLELAGQQQQAASRAHNAAGGAPSCLTRAARVPCRDDAESDSGDEIEAEVRAVDGDGDEEEASGLRYCSYESITAAEGLSARSFEELRAECYAQSLIARGTTPSPVTQPALAIPPAFVPRIVSRSS